MKMSESQLLAALETFENQSVGVIQDDRVEALDYYLGRPMGNEVEGRSQVIARQVWDTVEWLKPQIADIFTSGEEIVAFAPRGPEDVKAAEQETDYVNHLITQRNNWFEIWYAWTHDALIQKNGYVKAYWDDAEDTTCEEYHGLTADEFALLQMAEGIKITEVEENADPMTGQVTYDVEVERTRPRNVVKIENIPPENVRVSHNARGVSLQDDRLDWVQHAEMKTISELRNEGFDVADDIGDDGENAGRWERTIRNEDSPFSDRLNEESDPSMRRVLVKESWIRCDFDGDGRAELRHVIVVGTSILENEDCDCVPLVALCPTPLAHKHYGLSVADAVMDLQRIQTALLRGALDNQYLANNGRYGVNENNVNLDDMLDSRPGGIVRINGEPGVNITPLTHPTTGNIAVPMMEYVDRLAQKRTGVNEQNQGLDPNSLNKTATGAQLMLTASQQRIKFIARVFAETGIKRLFQLVHELTLKNSRQQQIVELRGQWVPVNPREWTKRTDLVISVALGAGDRVQQLAYLAQQRQMQLEMLPLGLAKPENLFATVSRMTRAAGYKDAQEFWTDPAQNPPPPPQPPLEIQLEQMKQQGAAQKLQAEQANDAQKFQAEMQLKGQAEILQSQAKQRETQMQLELQAANDERDRQRQAETDARSHQIEMERLAMDRYLKEMEIASRERIEAAKLQATLQAAEMQRSTTLETTAFNAQQSARQAMQTETVKSAPEKQKADHVGKLAEMHGATLKAIQGLAEVISKPKKVVRGPDGKIVGTE